MALGDYSGAPKLWSCALPDCYHYMPAHMSAMVVGKASLCMECNEQFVLDPMNMRDDNPRCDNCRGLSEYDEVIPKSLVEKLGLK